MGHYFTAQFPKGDACLSFSSHYSVLAVLYVTLFSLTVAFLAYMVAKYSKLLPDKSKVLQRCMLSTQYVAQVLHRCCTGVAQVLHRRVFVIPSVLCLIHMHVHEIPNGGLLIIIKGTVWYFLVRQF